MYAVSPYGSAPYGGLTPQEATRLQKELRYLVLTQGDVQKSLKYFVGEKFEYIVDNNEIDDSFWDDDYNTGSSQDGYNLRLVHTSADSANGDNEGRILIKFPVDNIPSNATIISATIKLHSTYGAPDEIFKVRINRVTEDWDETTMTYKNRPSSTGYYTTFETIDYPDTTFDVTDLVQDWVDHTYDNYGIEIEQEEVDVYEPMHWRDSEDSTEEYRPVITVTYVVPPSPKVTKSLQYAVRKVYSVTKDLVYCVLDENAITKAVKYAVLSAQSVQKSTQYTVQTTDSVEKSLEYYVRTSDVIQKSLAYEVLSEQAIQLTAKYTVKTTPSAITKSLAYYIVETDLLTKSVRYAIRETNQITKESKYVVVSPKGVQLTLGYRLTVEEVYTKRTDYYPNDDVEYTGRADYFPL